MRRARGSSYKLREGQLLLWLVAIERATVLETDVLGCTGEQLRGEMRQMLAGLLYYGVDGRAAHDETATGTGAFAKWKEGGVTVAHAHLRGMHAQRISDDLGKRGLGALAMRRDAGIDADVPGGCDGYLSALDAMVSCGTRGFEALARQCG